MKNKVETCFSRLIGRIVLLMAAVMLFGMVFGIVKNVHAADTIVENFDLAVNDTWVSGETTSNNNIHFYKIVTTKPGMLTVSIENMASGQIFFFTDASKVHLGSNNGQIVSGSSGGIWGSSEVTPYAGSRSYYLEKGTYYVKIYPYNYGNYYGKYRVKASLYDFENNETEPNQNASQAQKIKFKKLYKGLISQQDSCDWFKFVLEETETVCIRLRHYSSGTWWQLKRSDSTTVNSGTEWGGSIDSPAVKYITVELEPGTYYFKNEYISSSGSTRGVRGFYDILLFRPVSAVELSGRDTLYVGETVKLGRTITPSNATYPKLYWSSSNSTVATVNKYGTVTAKKPGTVTITAKNTTGGTHSGTHKITVIAKPTPTKVQLTGATNLSNRRMKLTWKKATEATGYQIQYSTNSSFKSGNTSVKVKSISKTTKTIKNLKKGKKYYVRIRTYVIGINGKYYYSGWSKVKNVTIKK